MLKMRNYDRAEEPPGRLQRRRWPDLEGPAFDPTLIEPICQAAIVRYRLAGRRHTDIILFSNPANNKDT